MGIGEPDVVASETAAPATSAAISGDITGAADVATIVLRQIAPEADIDGIDPDGLLHEQIDFDSMDFLNFVAGLHERTGVDLPERDYPEIATLTGYRAYLRSHRPVIA